MKEWSKSNQFNSFNSWKGLLYSEWYKAIIEWRDGVRTAPLPPIEVSLDPIHACQLMCEHCNAHRYLTESIPGSKRMSDEHIVKLTKAVSVWGVKGICWGGGGEPSLHTKLGECMEIAHKMGVKNSIATNGINYDDTLIRQAVETCRWIGVSIDAAKKETYKIGRKADKFDVAVTNIKKMVKASRKAKSGCDVSFKFLIFDYNQHEIYDACLLAKKLGVRDFHARPADWRHQGLGDWKKKQGIYDLDLIKQQFEKCHSIETEKFRVFTVTHKFNADFTPRREFEKCWASPICIQLCANGKIYLCPDVRHSEDYELGEHFPDPSAMMKMWGSKKHYDMVFGDTAKKCTSRCTFSPYNTQMEKLFVGDDNPMCWQFV